MIEDLSQGCSIFLTFQVSAKFPDDEVCNELIHLTCLLFMEKDAVPVSDFQVSLHCSSPVAFAADIEIAHLHELKHGNVIYLLASAGSLQLTL